ncbi:MAG TPA: AAA family ATPase, partial [Dehalococcoidia bacterium]|nr:AAA family ATPase [Dehalococcoidia bacterium]
GCVVAPPSLHVSGQAYNWKCSYSTAPLAEVPDRLAAALNGDPPTLTEAILFGHWAEDSRHKLTLGAAGFLAKAGVGLETTSQIIRNVCAESGDDETPDRLRAVEDTYGKLERGEAVSGLDILDEQLPDDALAILKKAWRKTSVHEVHVPIVGQRFTLSEIMSSTPEPIEWLLSEFVPRLPIVAFAGAPGVGKSWLVEAMGLAIAGGQPFLGQYQTRQAKVILLDAENPKIIVMERIRRLAAGMGLPEDIPFVVRTNVHIDLTQKPGQDGLRSLIEEERPEVVVLDTLSSFHSANENDGQEMTGVMRTLRQFADEFEATFLLLHHLRKASRFNTGNGVDAYKGAVNIAAQTDVAFNMKELPGGVAQIEVVKQRVPALKEKIGVMILDTEKGVEVVQVEGPINRDDLRRQFIEDLMRSRPNEGMSRAEILKAARASNLGNVDPCLKSMKQDGILETTKEGRTVIYRLAPDGLGHADYADAA